MKNNYLTIRILALTFLFSGILFASNLCAQQQEERHVKGFDKISISISADLILTQGSDYKLVIEAKEKSDLGKVVTEVEGNKLKIKSKPGSWKINKVKVYVTLPELKALAISGSSDVRAEKTMETDEFSVAISGSGDVRFADLQANDLNIAISGSGDVKMAGHAKSSVRISTSGSGDVNVEGLETKNVHIAISGSGDARVFATETLNCKVSGSGDVYYKGGAQVNAKSTGSGSISAL
jgi:carbon monoxide dehydrogenase subunit G